MPAKYDDLELAYMLANNVEYEVYICRRTGEPICHCPSELAESDDLPDDIEDAEKYVQFPDQRELGLGVALVFDFVAIHLPSDSEDVRAMFRRRGAYSKFKSLLERRGVMKAWHAFENTAIERALRQWCSENEIEVEVPSPL